MTTAQALLIFDVLQDQYGAPYFPEDWKLKLLNMAQLEVLNKMFPDSLGGVVNFEIDANTLRNITPLIYTTYSQTAVSGQLPFSTINTDISTITPNSTLFAIIAVGVANSNGATPAKYVSHNKFWTYRNNVFKNGSTTNYIYKIETTNLSGKIIFFYPEPPAASITVTVIKNPTIMTAGNSPDWDDYVMNQVILQALKLAGIAVSGTEEIQNVLQSGIQSGQ